MRQPDATSRRSLSRAVLRAGAAALLAGAAALLLASCSATDGTSRPPTTAPATVEATQDEPTPELTLLPTEAGTTSQPGSPSQTDTEWGRIWEGLPTGFPVFPGAHSTELGSGPASATLDAGSAEPRAVVNFYQTALQASGWIVTGVAGPREDGSFELSSVDIHPACQVQTTVTPLGGSTIVTILYGAGCPFNP